MSNNDSSTNEYYNFEHPEEKIKIDCSNFTFIPITNYPGYEIATEYPYYVRFIKSKKLVKDRPEKYGYCVTLTNKIDNKKKKIFKHRLIAEMFLPNDDVKNKTFLLHKNNNVYDNHLENLIWNSSSKLIYNVTSKNF